MKDFLMSKKGKTIIFVVLLFLVTLLAILVTKFFSSHAFLDNSIFDNNLVKSAINVHLKDPKGTDVDISLDELLSSCSKGGEITLDDGTIISTGEYQEICDVYINFEKPKTLAEKIESVRTLYDVGEVNLTIDDIVRVNNIDCYVLQVDEENNKAELITKGIYDQRFSGSKTSYNYKTSTLKTWMDNFYTNYLGEDKYIMMSDVVAYYNTSYGGNIGDLLTYSTVTVQQYVFALDAIEAQTYASKFSWDDYNSYIDNEDKLATNFWVSGGRAYGSTQSLALMITNSGEVGRSLPTNSNAGARPAFWISLD